MATCCRCGEPLAGPNNEDSHTDTNECVRVLRADLATARAERDAARGALRAEAAVLDGLAHRLRGNIDDKCGNCPDCDELQWSAECATTAAANLRAALGEKGGG